MLRGLPGSNTKLVLVETRLWALPTLGRVFSYSSWSSLQDTPTNSVLWIQIPIVLQFHALHI